MLRRLIYLLPTLLLSHLGIAQTTIIIDSVPVNTPVNATIHIAGDFQNWNPSSTAHTFEYDTALSTYAYTLPMGTGSIEFKFTRGSWNTVESDANGNFIQNRTFTPIPGDTAYFQIAGWEDLNGSGGLGSTAADNVEILADSFYMTRLNRYRRVWVYLPPDYHFGSKTYPVLYMHDGQNVFDAATSFAGEWQVDETLNLLYAQGDSGIIVVAVDNGGSNRINEYTPWSNPTYGGGEGADYVDFLVDELIPHINNNYRTKKGRDYTGIMGSSIGGHISIYAGLKHLDVFGKIGSLSPSYWINPEIFEFVHNNPKIESMRIYQVMAQPEGLSHINRMQAMHDSLLEAGYDSADIKTVVTPDGAHSEWYWAREFEAAYLWLFRNISTGLTNQRQTKSSVRLYPNPIADGHLFLELNSPKTEDVTVEVIDSSGTGLVVYTGVIQQTGTSSLEIPRSKLPKARGIYFLRVTFSEEIELVRFVVL